MARNFCCASLLTKAFRCFFIAQLTTSSESTPLLATGPRTSAETLVVLSSSFAWSTAVRTSFLRRSKFWCCLRISSTTRCTHQEREANSRLRARCSFSACWM